MLYYRVLSRHGSSTKASSTGFYRDLTTMKLYVLYSPPAVRNYLRGVAL